MARTKKGSKGPGYEYWGRRPYNKGPNQNSGKITKRICHQMERAIAKREILHELNDL